MQANDNQGTKPLSTRSWFLRLNETWNSFSKKCIAAAMTTPTGNAPVATRKARSSSRVVLLAGIVVVVVLASAVARKTGNSKAHTVVQETPATNNPARFNRFTFRNAVRVTGECITCR